MSIPPSAGAAGQPRVFLVDDHAMFRSGVRSELAGHVQIVGEADDVGPAITAISECTPDVVLLDVHLPGGGGQAVVAALKPQLPDVRFLALSASDAPEDVIAVIRAGARGYVTKTISGPDLVDAVLDQLTTREREVLRLIARGYTYKEIARDLFISVKTVESHVSSVLRKLQLSTRHQLTRWATERRLT